MTILMLCNMKKINSEHFMQTIGLQINEPDCFTQSGAGIHKYKIKFKVYKKVIKEVSEKFEEAKDFISNRINDMCSQGKLSIEEVIYIFAAFFQFMFPCWLLAVK